MTRTVGDQYTWKLPLDIQGVDLRPQMSSSSTPFQFDPVAFNGWSLVERYGQMATIYDPIRLEIFRYNYTTGSAMLHLHLYRFMTEQCSLRRMSLENTYADIEEIAQQTWYVDTFNSRGFQNLLI
jgi:hypothetical protein